MVFWHNGRQKRLKCHASAGAKYCTEVAERCCHRSGLFSRSRGGKSSTGDGRGNPLGWWAQGHGPDRGWRLSEVPGSRTKKKSPSQASQKSTQRRGLVLLWTNNCLRQAVSRKQRVFRGWKNPDTPGNVGAGREFANCCSSVANCNAYEVKGSFFFICKNRSIA